MIISTTPILEGKKIIDYIGFMGFSLRFYCLRLNNTNVIIIKII